MLIGLLQVALMKGQSDDQRKTDSVLQLVKQFYNQQDAVHLHQLLGPNLGPRLSEKELQDYLRDLHFLYGKWSSHRLLGLQQGVSRYWVNFEGIPFYFFMGLDNKGKIRHFVLRPYENPETVSKKAMTDNPLAAVLDSEVEAKLRPYVSRANVTGISIGIWYHGHSYSYDYGEVIKGTEVLPTANTVYEIGALTQTFTAALLAKSALEGRINLDDPVNKYLPDSIPSLQYLGIPITLRSLANHSSGLPRLPPDLWRGTNGAAADPYKNSAADQLLHCLRTFKPYRMPGVQYEESDLAFGLLGFILETVYHQPLEQLIIDEICRPLGMSDTRISITDDMRQRLAMPSNDQGQTSSGGEFRSMAGAIHSTTKDLLQYARAQMAPDTGILGRAFQLAQQASFRYNENTVAGLGWLIREGNKRHSYFRINSTGRFRSYLAFDKEQHCAIVILANATAEVGSIGDELLQWMTVH